MERSKVFPGFFRPAGSRAAGAPGRTEQRLEIFKNSAAIEEVFPEVRVLPSARLRPRLPARLAGGNPAGVLLAGNGTGLKTKIPKSAWKTYPAQRPDLSFYRSSRSGPLLSLKNDPFLFIIPESASAAGL
jgi:hypothetical protein